MLSNFLVCDCWKVCKGVLNVLALTEALLAMMRHHRSEKARPIFEIFTQDHSRSKSLKHDQCNSRNVLNSGNKRTNVANIFPTRV